MVDQVVSAETCRVCGAPLDENQMHFDGLCRNCAEANATQGSYDAQSAAAPDMAFEPAPIPQQETPPDPDRPPWGPASGISVWVLSVAAVIVIPIVAVLVWYLIQSARGAPLPNLAVRDELVEWLKSPNLLLV